MSFALIAGGGSLNNGSMFWLGTAGFVIGAPVNHLINGRPGRALGSLGIRTLAGGLAVGWVLLDVLSHPCDGEPSCHHVPTAGLSAGALTLLTAMILDDAYLAREVVSAPTPPARVTLAPAVLVGPDLAFLSVAGKF